MDKYEFVQRKSKFGGFRRKSTQLAKTIRKAQNRLCNVAYETSENTRGRFSLCHTGYREKISMWYRGHCNKIWSEEYKHLDFFKQPISQTEIDNWKSQGYLHESFTGTMYDSTNPMPGWTSDIAHQLGLHHAGFVFYKMITGDIMPVHIDHYNRYCKIFDTDRSQVWRAIVFLEDWKPGHYFEIDGTAIIDYTAGDYVLWSADTPHMAANIGIQDRYTLQVTGTRDLS